MRFVLWSCVAFDCNIIAHCVVVRLIAKLVHAVLYCIIPLRECLAAMCSVRLFRLRAAFVFSLLCCV